jgi:hypothetical protein
VVVGKGFEAVVTLGTGVGTAFFMDGRLLPHFEFAHHPLGKKGSYNDVVGEAARRSAGNKKWEKRALEMIEVLRALTFFDHCFVGGGNAVRLGSKRPDRVSVVDNSAGILGGIKLWERTAAPPSAAPSLAERPRPSTRKARPPAKAASRSTATATKTPATRARSTAAKKQAPPAAG